jgi:hypothetical protein
MFVNNRFVQRLARIKPMGTDQLMLDEFVAVFRKQKDLADRAIAQTSDTNLRMALDRNTNSIAIIIKHMAGNMLSRWTAFLTTDGEKPDRNRDQEFIDTFVSRAEIMECWERGWNALFGAMRSLKPGDLTRIVSIRGEHHTAMRAIMRQVDHYGYHIGQIVQVARVLAKDNWTTLSIPRGGSDAFNRRTWKN